MGEEKGDGDGDDVVGRWGNGEQPCSSLRSPSSLPPQSPSFPLSLSLSPSLPSFLLTSPSLSPFPKPLPLPHLWLRTHQQVQ